MGATCRGTKVQKGPWKSMLPGLHGQVPIRLGLKSETKWVSLGSFSDCFNKISVFQKKTEVLVIDSSSLRLPCSQVWHVPLASLSQQFKDPKTSGTLFSFKHLVIFSPKDLFASLDHQEVIDLRNVATNPLLEFIKMLLFETRIPLLSLTVCVQSTEDLLEATKDSIPFEKLKGKAKILFDSRDLGISLNQKTHKQGTFSLIYGFKEPQVQVEQKPRAPKNKSPHPNESPREMVHLDFHDKHFLTQAKTLIKKGGLGLVAWKDTAEKDSILKELAVLISKSLKLKMESVMEYFREIHVKKIKEENHQQPQKERTTEKKDEKSKISMGRNQGEIGLESKRVEEMKKVIESVNKKERESTFDTIRTLMSNIIKEPNNEKFRKVRASNKKIQGLIHGKQESVLHIIGFYPLEEGSEKFFVNKLSDKEMRLIEADFNLGVAKLPK